MDLTSNLSRRLFLALLSQPWLLRSERAALSLRVSTGGLPTAARVYITDQDGKPFQIAGAISYSRRGESHTIVDRSAVANLPPGRYIVRAEKGAEFRGVERTVDLTADGTTRLDLDIPPFCDMNAQG